MSEICYYGNPVLREVSAPISVFDDELAEFGEHLVEMMYEYDGIGLAAPQIGISKRVIAVDISEGGDTPLVIINPEITWRSEEVETENEGCLSVPGIRAGVERPISVTVSGYDLAGKAVTFEETTGLFARCLQHEMDHLEGLMFVDKVAPARKVLLKGKLKKLARNYNK